MFEIIDVRELAPKNKLIKLKAPLIAKKAQAGQFIVLRINEAGERIPLTLADWDKEKGTITLIFQEVGKSSYELGIFKKGDFIQDCVGPLGIPSHISKLGLVVGIGGGLGIAPLYPIMREFKKSGNKVISIIGARFSNLLFWEEEL
ncbi:MAG: sulfide/dihydroorotate dehydrogenase-like FAD/NAD-binding protein, partial [Armatimonadetes bacterium]|nr:sulfide/dihydroorotate dehydrogenase-like FAD/NAD-binding protein [Armatimonadota bacterium]